MNERTLMQRTLRVAVALLAAAFAILLPAGSVILWALAGAIVALDGIWRPFFPFLVLAVCAEQVGAMGLGTWSLPFVLSILLLSSAGAFVALGPWNRADGWDIGGAVRAWAVAFVSGMLMSAMNAVRIIVFNGYPFGPTVRSIVQPASVAWIAVAVAVFLIILRRIDVPFRTRRVYSGT